MTFSEIRSIKRSLLNEIIDNVKFDTEFTPPKVLRSKTLSNFTQGRFKQIVLSKNKFGYKAYVAECFAIVKPNLDECIQQLVEQLYDARYALGY